MTQDWGWNLDVNKNRQWLPVLHLGFDLAKECACIEKSCINELMLRVQGDTTGVTFYVASIVN